MYMKDKVLFVASNLTSLTEQIQISRVLSSRAVQYFLLPSQLRISRLLEQLPTQVVLVDKDAQPINLAITAESPADHRANFLRTGRLQVGKIFSRFVHDHAWIYAAWVWFKSIFNLNRQQKHLRLEIRRAQGAAHCLYEDLGINVAVFAGDRSVAYNLALLKAFHEIGVRTLIPPISFVSGPERLLASRRRDVSYHCPGRGKFRTHYPNLYHFDRFTGKRVGFYTVIETAEFTKADIHSSNPWALGAGYIDSLLVDGKRTENQLIQLGCHAEKIKITGHGSHDKLFETVSRKDEIRSRFIEKYDLHPDRRTLILSMPQLGEHNLLSWEQHWQEVDFLCSELGRLDVSILVSLHPKMDRRKYEPIAIANGLHLVDEPLREFIVVADLFVSTFSSTVYWAVLCGVPPLVVDFYELNYTDNDWLKGIQIVREREALVPRISETLFNQKLTEDIRTRCKEDAEQIAPFDGKAMERIIGSILS